MLITGSIPNFINGVSRQPSAVRLASQLEEQINGYSTVVEGLQKRPGSVHKGVLGDFTGSVFHHGINRDTAERYEVLINAGTLRVFNLDGAERTVTFPDGTSYLTSTGPAEFAFSAATSVDYTFITNKEVTAAMDPTQVFPLRPAEALVYIRAVNFNRTYTIRVNGDVVAQYKTSDGASTNATNLSREERAVTPANVARILFWGATVSGTVGGHTTTDGGFADAEYDDGASLADVISRLADTLPFASWEIARYNSVLYIRNKAGTPFTISVDADTDAQNRQSIIVVQNEVTNFSDLPDRGPAGYVVEITGTSANKDDNYWVQFIKDGNSNDNDVGTWRECPEPGSLTTFDYDTMPHILVREADGNFTFRVASEWDERRVGGDAGSPAPSFIGRKINDVFFSKGRLCMLAGENTIQSRSQLPFDFWRLTMTTILDDDPIDVGALDGAVATLSHGVPQRAGIVLTSPQAVYSLTGGRLMSPATAAIDISFEEPFNVRARPVKSTRTILMASTATLYGDVREMFIGDDPDNSTIGSVADHINGYLPVDIVEMVSFSKSCMFLRCTSAPSTIFVYQWYWVGQEKKQSAWHRWDFATGTEVLGMKVFDERLYILTRRGTKVSLEFFELSSQISETNSMWGIHLDRKVYVTGTYSAGTNTTTLTLPYPTAGDTSYIATVYGTDEHGVAPEVVTHGDTTMVLSGEWTGPMCVGLNYVLSVELSKHYFRQARGGALVALEADRLQVLRHLLKVSQTSYFRVEVVPAPGSSTRVVAYSPLRAGNFDASLGVVNLSDEPIKVPVKGKGSRAKVTLINDTHYPSSFLGSEWEGSYQPRAKVV